MNKYINRKINYFLIAFFEKILLEQILSNPIIDYSFVQVQDNSVVKWRIKFELLEENCFDILTSRYAAGCSKLELIFFNFIYILHIFLKNKSARQNEVISYISRSIFTINNDFSDNYYNTSVILFERKFFLSIIDKIISDELLHLKMSDNRNKVPINIDELSQDVQSHMVPVQNNDNDHDNDNFIYDLVECEYIVEELCTNNLSIIVGMLFDNNTKNFVNFFKERLFDINGELDFAFLTYALLIPNKKSFGVEQMKRILNAAPRKEQFFLFDKESGICEADLIDLNLVTENFNEFCVDEREFYDKENLIFAFFCLYSGLGDEVISSDKFLKFEGILNKMFEKYTNNQIERLFTSRHGFVYFALIFLTELEKQESIFELEKCKILNVDTNFKNMIYYIAKNKTINNKNLDDLNGKMIDGYFYKVLKTAIDYRDAAESFNNCVLSYYSEYPEIDIVGVYSGFDGLGVACVSIDDGEITQILGPHNEILLEDQRIKITNVLQKCIS